MVRLVLDIFIFFARNMVLTFALVLLCALWVARRGRWDVGLSPHLNRSVVVVAVGLGILFLGIGGWYLTEDGFAGEVEPVVSSLSWLVQKGQPLYNDFSAAERYSVLYGPSVFLTNGLFLKILGPSLASAKLASLLGMVGSLVFMYLAVARRRRDPVALAAVAVAILFYWTQGFAVYLVRPDSLLVFAVALGVYAAARARGWLAVAAVAATAGFAINLKAHGLVYFLPVFGLLAARMGLRVLMAATAGTLLTVALPFLYAPQVSLVNYVGWLTNAMSHGLETHTLGQTFGYAAFLLAPLVAIVMAAGDRAGLVRDNRVGLVLLLPVYGLTLLLAAKPGAGPVHLLPLVPTTIHLAVTLVRDPAFALADPVLRHRMRGAVLTATAVTALLAGTVNAYRAVRFVDYQIGQTPDLAADVRQIIADYPEVTISMACGGENRFFRATWLRPLLVFADHPLLIDPISVMDSSLSGRTLSAETYRAISDGRVDMWLVPRHQEPFAKENWYAPHNPLFPTDFQDHFAAWYTPRAHSRYFDLWFWNGLPDEVPRREFASGGGAVGGVMRKSP